MLSVVVTALILNSGVGLRGLLRVWMLLPHMNLERMSARKRLATYLATALDTKYLRDFC